MFISVKSIPECTRRKDLIWRLWLGIVLALFIIKHNLFLLHDVFIFTCLIDPIFGFRVPVISCCLVTCSIASLVGAFNYMLGVVVVWHCFYISNRSSRHALICIKRRNSITHKLLIFCDINIFHIIDFLLFFFEKLRYRMLFLSDFETSLLLLRCFTHIHASKLLRVKILHVFLCFY